MVKSPQPSKEWAVVSSRRRLLIFKYLEVKAELDSNILGGNVVPVPATSIKDNAPVGMPSTTVAASTATTTSISHVEKPLLPLLSKGGKESSNDKAGKESLAGKTSTINIPSPPSTTTLGKRRKDEASSYSSSSLSLSSPSGQCSPFEILSDDEIVIAFSSNSKHGISSNSKCAIGGHGGDSTIGFNGISSNSKCLLSNLGSPPLLSSSLPTSLFNFYVEGDGDMKPAAKKGEQLPVVYC